MSKENLLEKIEQDAAIAAEAIITEAKERNESILNALNSDLKAFEESQKESIQKSAEENYKRKLTLAHLEAKKTVLFNKQKLIDKVYGDAVSDILNLKDEEYLGFIVGLLKAAAENNDEVIISNLDNKRITKSVIEKVAAERGITLTLSKDFGEFNGGFILKNANYDKDLSLLTISLAIREITEAEVVKALFKN